MGKLSISCIKTHIRRYIYLEKNFGHIGSKVTNNSFVSTRKTASNLSHIVSEDLEENFRQTVS